ncbi:MAG: DinB family protein [Phycisphaerales bacterium]|nr:MAG: DinB family protein [Phycisphaerales bacterium]
MNSQVASVGAYIADCLQVCLGYGRMLVEDIPADKFFRLPQANMNHPAFLLGHITLSADQALAAIGRPELGTTPEGYRDLFGIGSECVDEAGRYPPKDEIVAYYGQRHEQAIDALHRTPEEVFQGENPAEGQLREMFPTVGAVVNFGLNCHHMAHLGQISAWRRVMGLGPVLNL